MAKPIQLRRRKRKNGKYGHWILYKEGISIFAFSHWELGMKYLRESGLFDQKTDFK